MAFIPDNPAEAPKGRFVPDAPKAPAGQPDLLDRARGAIEAVGQPIAAAASAIPASIAGNVAGAFETVTGGGFGSPEATRRGAERAREVSSSLTYQPRNPAARGALDTVGHAIERSGIQGVNPAVPLSAVGPGAGAAVRQGAGKVAEAVKGAPGKVLDAAAGKLAKNVPPETMELARRAQELGIDIRPDMLSDNKFVRMIGEALDRVPLSGTRGDKRQIAFNRALGNMIGADPGATKLTPKVFDAAMTASGEKIGEIATRTPVPMNEGFDQALASYVSNASRYETADVAKIVRNYVNELREKAGADGVIPGKAYRKLNTKIGTQMRRTSNGDLKNALDDLQEIMHEALSVNLKGGDAEMLAEARRQYAIAKAISPLVAKSKNGDISPAGLMGAVTSDSAKKEAMARNRGADLGELARIGQMFLKEPDSSGTAERSVAFGLLGGGALMEPTTAASVYGAANLYNRAGPSIARRMTRVKDMTADERATLIKDLQ